MESSIAAHWAALDDHFENHVKLVGRFREAGEDAVLLMWQSQTNEIGEPLSQFERDALVERHCELFGTWPYVCKPHCAAQAADLKSVDLCISATPFQKVVDHPPGQVATEVHVSSVKVLRL